MTVTSLGMSKMPSLCSNPGIPFWTHEKTQKLHARYKRLILYHTLTSWSFSRWDRVYTNLCFWTRYKDRRSHCQCQVSEIPLSYDVLHWHPIIKQRKEVYCWKLSESINTAKWDNCSVYNFRYFSLTKMLFSDSIFIEIIYFLNFNHRYERGES